jgi:hypothetical protein
MATRNDTAGEIRGPAPYSAGLETPGEIVIPFVSKKWFHTGRFNGAQRKPAYLNGGKPVIRNSTCPLRLREYTPVNQYGPYPSPSSKP